MRTRSIGHACLEIETSGLRLLTDPWWAGPAYTNQWYAWPTPQPGGIEERPVDYLYLSHGHEDHLHADTLRRLRPGATALVPEFLSGSLGGYLRDELGFCHVVEMPHGETITLRRGLRATCYVNVTDSILVLDDGDRVVVNANDALHASSPTVIDYFCRLLRERHPQIDALYLGFAGASWFPNCLRLPRKDDREVARGREQLFLDNFVRVVDALRPRIASAYAASFVLLEPHNRWITDVKFDLPTPDEEYARRRPGSATRCHLLLPGDVIDGVDIIGGTTPRPTREAFAAACENELREACERAEHLQPLTPDALREIVTRLDTRVRANRTRLDRTAQFSVELRLREAPGTALRVEVKPGGEARALLGAPRETSAALDLRTEILEAAMRDDYGIESIVIGYGAVASLANAEQFAHVQALLQLLSPRVGSLRAVLDGIRREPGRGLGALWRQRMPLALALGTRLGLLSHPYELRNLEREPSGIEPEPRRAA